MIDNQVMQYLKSLAGGEWGSEEKKNKLYDLVHQCAREFPDTKLLSVELGTFGGAGVFPLALAHKELNNGWATAIDSWENKDCTEGTMAEVDRQWWATVDLNSIFAQFKLATIRKEWSGNIEYLKGRTDEFAGSFPDDSITLLHQDSSHTVEAITRELELWVPKLKMGGYWICDDTNWGSSKAGYAKLPSFGLELVEKFESWEIWKKTGAIASVPVVNGGNFVSNTRINTMLQMAELNNRSTALDREALNINGSVIKPILLFLPDTQEWLERWHKGTQHLNDNGIYPYHVPGVHAAEWGITGTHFYMRDTWNRMREKYGDKMPRIAPDELKNPYYMGDGKVGGCISHYILYNVMMAMPYDYYMVLECDARFGDGWKQQLSEALKNIPPDFDFLYVGSSDAANKEGTQIKGNLYHFPHREGKESWYPMSGHCYIVAKKALPIILATQREVSTPVDISLIYEAFPYLNVFAVLPRLAEQENTGLNP